MEITIEHNPYQLELSALMVLAKRLNNPKRNFLFVSKVLGKHLPIDPRLTQVSGFLLAARMYGPTSQTPLFCAAINQQQVDQQALANALQQRYPSQTRSVVVGFAETATGIGMAVANALSDTYYLHTTREPLIDQSSILAFEEEHSHATTHYCFLNDREQLQQAETLIFVDDELTTGQSMINLLRVFMPQTQAKKVRILTILDWRTAQHDAKLQAVAAELGIEVCVESLIAGTVTQTDPTVYQHTEPIPHLTANVATSAQLDLQVFPRTTSATTAQTWNYYTDSGRFGVSQARIARLQTFAQTAAQKITTQLLNENPAIKRILVVGHGEDIFIPSLVASAMQPTFSEVAFKTTTRSPIYCSDQADYPLQEIHTFVDQEANRYYFYNQQAAEQRYDYVVFIVERPLAVQLVKNQLTVLL